MIVLRTAETRFIKRLERKAAELEARTLHLKRRQQAEHPIKEPAKDDPKQDK
jgi:hypothetical protein